MADVRRSVLRGGADRVWVARYDWMDVNITLIGGDRGLLDGRHPRLGARRPRMIADDLRRLGAGPLTALVNTHDHWDHCFGNDVFRTAYGDLPIHATEFALRPDGRARGAATTPHLADDPRAEEILATTLVPRPTASPPRSRSTWATGSSS